MSRPLMHYSIILAIVLTFVSSGCVRVEDAFPTSPSVTPTPTVPTPTPSATATPTMTPTPTVPTPTPSATATPTMTPTPTQDTEEIIKVVAKANKELQDAFLDVGQQWTSSQFDYWCSQALTDVIKYGVNRNKKLQPKSGRIVVEYELVGTPKVTLRESNKWKVVQTEKWTFEYEIKPDATPPVVKPPVIEGYEYEYQVTMLEKRFCVISYLGK